MTHSHIEKWVLVLKQGFSVNWSICKWISITWVFCVYQYLHQPGREAQSQQVMALGVTGVGFLEAQKASLSCSNCLHDRILTVQGVQTRRASKKSTQAAPSNSLSLRGERFSSLTLLQDLLCVLQPSVSTAWVSTKSLAFTAVRQQPVFVLPFFPRNDSQWSTSHLFFFFTSISKWPQNNNILLFSIFFTNNGEVSHILWKDYPKKRSHSRSNFRHFT